MNKDPTVFLKHIVQCIRNIEEDTKHFSKEKFIASRTIQDAVIRNIEVIGEAVKYIPSEFKKRYGEIPWVDISGMRDKLIHGYFGIDLNIVWDVIIKDLSLLKKQILEILEE